MEDAARKVKLQRNGFTEARLSDIAARINAEERTIVETNKKQRRSAIDRFIFRSSDEDSDGNEQLLCPNKKQTARDWLNNDSDNETNINKSIIFASSASPLDTSNSSAHSEKRNSILEGDSEVLKTVLVDTTVKSRNCDNNHTAGFHRGSVTYDCVSSADFSVLPSVFAKDNLPSSWARQHVSWIYIRTNRHKFLADNSYVGKWMLFVSPSNVDDYFVKIAEALESGLLGDSVKVSPESTSSNNSRFAQLVIIVYTNDFRDQADVLRVGLNLRHTCTAVLGGHDYRRTLSYKPDIFTVSDMGIYGANTLPKSIYQLRASEQELVETMQGQALKLAEELIASQKHNHPNHTTMSCVDS